MSVVIFLQAGLVAIMLSLGLSLTVADFKRVLVFPKAVILALFCQMLILPVTCFFIAKGFGLSPELAVGLMLLSATPGGVTANLFSHLSNGDVALNITLTAINSLLCLFSLPLILALSLAYFIEDDRVIPPQFSKIVEVCLVVVIPVMIGMYLRHRLPQFTEKLVRPMKLAAALFMLAMIAMVCIKQWDTLVQYFPVIGGAVLLFNLMSIGTGYGGALLAKLSKKQAIAIGMEVGIHNATLSMAVAFSPHLLDNPTMAIPSSVYGLTMLITASVFGFWVRERAKTGTVPA